MNVKTDKAKTMVKLIKSARSDFWINKTRQQPLKLFRLAAARVPAYKDFLRKNNINPEKVKNWKDFSNVPVVSRKNYLKNYSLSDLCWDGVLEKPLVFTSTSGSTGDPYFFPRGELLDWQSSVMHELFLSYSGVAKTGPTLVVVAFGMGIWIGGLITYQAFMMASRRNQSPLSIITPGINKNEIFNILKRLSPQYRSTIIVGYPPFVKDLLDEAGSQGVNLKKLNIKLAFAAETFTESFRDYLVKKAGVKNVYRDFYHVYGSADIGTMAAEMPACVLIKKKALEKSAVFKDLFLHSGGTPTLAQYNPYFINFESINNEILLTGNNAIPLIRYAIGDRGGVLSFAEAENVLYKNNVNLREEAKDAGISDCLYELPFVYIHERTDFAASLYGIIIYPQVVRESLLHPVLRQYLTGKFTLITKFDSRQNQYLEINLELKKNVQIKQGQKRIAESLLVEQLLKRSSEFRELTKHVGKRAHPKLIFWPAEDTTYFKPGIKQKWIR